MKYSIDSSTLIGIADAIRTQYGEDTPIAASDMAEAILGIEGGGGGSFLFETGTFTVLDGTQSPTVYHGLGKVPTFLMFATNATARDGRMCGGFYYPNFQVATRYTHLRFRTQYNLNPNYIDSAGDIIDITEDNFAIDTTSYNLVDGATYEWFAIYFEE